MVHYNGVNGTVWIQNGEGTKDWIRYCGFDHWAYRCSGVVQIQWGEKGHHRLSYCGSNGN